MIFLTMETMVCLSPGWAVLLVMSKGPSRGVLASIWTVRNSRSERAMFHGNVRFSALRHHGLTPEHFTTFDGRKMGQLGVGSGG
jgi:hypothetical protein